MNVTYYFPFIGVLSSNTGGGLTLAKLLEYGEAQWVTVGGFPNYAFDTYLSFGMQPFAWSYLSGFQSSTSLQPLLTTAGQPVTEHSATLRITVS